MPVVVGIRILQSTEDVNMWHYVLIYADAGTSATLVSPDSDHTQLPEY